MKNRGTACLLLLLLNLPLRAAAPNDAPLELIAEGVPAAQLIQALAESQGLNVAFGLASGQAVTLRLAKVTWRQALNAVTESAELAWRLKQGVIYIYPAKHPIASVQPQGTGAAARGPLLTETFRLRHIPVKELAAMLSASGQQVIGPGASVVADSRTNRLLVRDTRSGLNRLRHWVSQLDISLGQVELAAHIVTMNRHSLDALGVTWNRAGHEPPGATGVNVNLGVKEATSWAGFNVAKIGGRALGLALSALEQKQQLSIIASPRLLAAHQQPASIKQGSEIPYQVSNGNNNRNSVEFKDAVLGMDVTPEILEGQRIRLKLRITQNMPGQKLRQAEGEVLTIDKQEIETQVVVNSGETLALGGIFQTKRHEGEDAIPLMGKIPLLGGLFRQRNHELERRELVVFITPQIVGSQ